MSLDNLLTHCNNNIRWCLKGSDATNIFTLAQKEYKHQRIISWSTSWTHEVKNSFKNVSGLDCYYKGILCEIEDMKIVNTGHALQSSIISLGLLHIFAFESVLQSSFKFFASIHLLVFGSPFIISQLGSWVVSKKLANKSAWSSSYLLNPTSCLQRYNTFQRLLNQKSFQNPTK